MALGIKTTTKPEQGDIIQAEGTVRIYQKVSDTEAEEYDNAFLGDRFGYFTGQSVKISGINHYEFVLINRVLTSKAPDFSTPKFYVTTVAPVSFKANPDYNYLSTTTAVNTNFWGKLGTIISSVLGGFTGNNSTSTGPIVADKNTGWSNQTSEIQTQPEQESWLRKNALLVGSVVVLGVTSIIIFAVAKKNK